MGSKHDERIEMLFRYEDGNNCYRFSRGKECVYRRIVKRQNLVVTLLAEDVLGQVYQVGIVPDGSALEVWINRARIFSVVDRRFREDSIMLYA
jgi:hypothetical protein